MIEAIAFTERGERLVQEIQSMRGIGEVRLSRGYGTEKVSLSRWTKAAFETADALLFVGAAAIAVRAIAPYLKSKTSDPAVLVLDEGGRFVIPILSGHIGGANRLANRIADAIGGTPVVTTATDGRGLFAIDSWATLEGLTIVNPEQIKKVSSKLLRGETVTVASDQPIAGQPPEGVLLTTEKEGRADVVLSDRWAAGDALHLVPPTLTVGIGCRRGTPADGIAHRVDRLLQARGFHPAAVCRVCSIDLKKEEPGLVDFCVSRGLPFLTYTAEQLWQVEGTFSQSDFVKRVTGVDNVCERAALLGSEGGTLIGRKTAEDGITVAIAQKLHTIRWEETE